MRPTLLALVLLAPALLAAPALAESLTLRAGNGAGNLKTALLFGVDCHVNLAATLWEVVEDHGTVTLTLAAVHVDPAGETVACTNAALEFPGSYPGLEGSPTAGYSRAYSAGACDIQVEVSPFRGILPVTAQADVHVFRECPLAGTMRDLWGTIHLAPYAEP